ncbi:hypothetical protein B0I35DRAFT_472717 [Stachybotrys elegans]|uniref:Uncharacterized protein n=1 Tax=Stachybotrys elegans TaxID=80388 RepID=A0A8K0T0E3_9HYPO|nr:hypothetical protein B0I35DRAFT_472717 [Stachybotrys elegans]
MALLNPVYAFMVPFLFVVTVPLAVFAGITTTCAFCVLILRVIVVYIDIALSLVPQSLLGRKPRHLRFVHANGVSSRSPSNRSDSPSPHVNIGRRRRRRPSSVSAISGGSTTPVGDAGLGLIPSVGPERDFEGLGGWRVADGDDTIWTTINSRLELPDRQGNRNHHRTPSGGLTTPGEGSYLMMKGRARSPEARTIKASMSPNSSRARTPTGPPRALTGASNSDSYFPYTGSPKASRKQPLQTA